VQAGGDLLLVRLPSHGPAGAVREGDSVRLCAGRAGVHAMVPGRERRKLRTAIPAVVVAVVLVPAIVSRRSRLVTASLAGDGAARYAAILTRGVHLRALEAKPGDFRSSPFSRRPCWASRSRS
jgi:hypothetical protein